MPSWAKDPGIGNRLINARAETAAEKPAFRTALRRRPGVLWRPMGFYEWQRSREGLGTDTASDDDMPLFSSVQSEPGHVASRTRRTKQGVFCSDARRTGRLRWPGCGRCGRGPTTRFWKPCTILTTEPNALMRPIHDRMPVILRPEGRIACWLDPAMQDPAPLSRLLDAYPSEPMEAYRVGDLVKQPFLRHPSVY